MSEIHSVQKIAAVMLLVKPLIRGNHDVVTWYDEALYPFWQKATTKGQAGAAVSSFGVDGRATDVYGNTLLHVAVQQDAVELVGLLLVDCLDDVNAENSYGNTPLLARASTDSTKVSPPRIATLPAGAKPGFCVSLTATDLYGESDHTHTHNTHTPMRARMHAHTPTYTPTYTYITHARTHPHPHTQSYTRIQIS